jgi:hypothetical protein
VMFDARLILVLRDHGLPNDLVRPQQQ